MKPANRLGRFAPRLAALALALAPASGADAERAEAARTVYHDAEHPSHILLPVIP